MTPAGVLVERKRLRFHPLKASDDGLGVGHLKNERCALAERVQRVAKKPHHAVDHEEAIMQRWGFTHEDERLCVLDPPPC